MSKEAQDWAWAERKVQALVRKCLLMAAYEFTLLAREMKP